jgi:hypothetical protein
VNWGGPFEPDTDANARIGASRTIPTWSENEGRSVVQWDGILSDNDVLTETNRRGGTIVAHGARPSYSWDEYLQIWFSCEVPFIRNLPRGGPLAHVAGAPPSPVTTYNSGPTSATAANAAANPAQISAATFTIPGRLGPNFSMEVYPGRIPNPAADTPGAHGRGYSNNYDSLIQIWDMWHIKFQEIHWRPLTGAKIYNPDIFVYQGVIDIPIDDVPDYYTYLNKRNDFVNISSTNQGNTPHSGDIWHRNNSVGLPSRNVSGNSRTRSNARDTNNTLGGTSAEHEGDYRLYNLLSGIPEFHNGVRTRRPGTIGLNAYESFIFRPLRGTSFTGTGTAQAENFHDRWLNLRGPEGILRQTVRPRPYFTDTGATPRRNHYEDMFLWIKEWFNTREERRNGDPSNPNDLIAQLVKSREMFGFYDGKIDIGEWLVDVRP